MVAGTTLEALLRIRPEQLCTFETHPLQDAFKRILSVLQEMKDDHLQLQKTVQDLQKENQQLRVELNQKIDQVREIAETAALRIGSHDSIEKISVKVTMLEKDCAHFAKTEDVVQNTSDLKQLRDTVLRMDVNLSAVTEEAKTSTKDIALMKDDSRRLLEDFVTEKIERKRNVHDLDTSVLKINEAIASMSGDIKKVDSIKANKTDLVAIEQQCQNAENIANNSSKLVETVKNVAASLAVTMDERLAKKANLTDLADKLGRVECEEFLQGLASRLGSELHKNNRTVADMREELDFVLATLLNKQPQASGLLKCMSCSKVIPNLHKPGALPQTHRSPVLVAGEDNKYYKRRESMPDTASEIETYMYTPHWPHSSSLEQRNGTTVLPPTAENNQGQVNEPAPPRRPKSARSPPANRRLQI